MKKLEMQQDLFEEERELEQKLKKKWRRKTTIYVLSQLVCVKSHRSTWNQKGKVPEITGKK